MQFQLDPEIYARLFAEVFLYLRQQRPVHPWQAVVIYPSRAVDPGEHHHYAVLLQSPQVVRVYLDEWTRPRQTLSQRLIGLLLDDPPQVVAEAQAVVRQVRSGELVDKRQEASIVELVETILVYKLPKLNRREIQVMLELTDTDLKQTRFYQEVFAEGEQEGREKGRQEGEVTLVLRQLQRRCGALAPSVTEQVARLNAPQLEALGEALLEFRELADLKRWLATHERK